MDINYPLLPPSPYSSASGYNSHSTRGTKPTPPTLWRMYDASSVSQRLPDGGFYAGSPERTIDMNDPEDVAVEIKLHLNWYSPVKTMFISASASFSWVKFHAARRDRKGRVNVRVAQISTARALECGVEPFHMMALAEFSGSEIPERAKNAAHDEWVFVRTIPPWAVVGDWSVSEFTALRGQQFRTEMDYNFFVLPGIQYPIIRGWGLNPVVNQSFNVGYGLSWQNLSSGLWQIGSQYIWQGPLGPLILPPLTTPPSHGDNVYTPLPGPRTENIFSTQGGEGGLAEVAADDQGPVYILPALNSLSIDATARAGSSALPTPTTITSVGSYINYPSLPDLSSKIATNRSLARAAVVEPSEGQQQVDNESIVDFDPGYSRISNEMDACSLYQESGYWHDGYWHDGYLQSESDHGYGVNEDEGYVDEEYGEYEE